MYRMKIVYIDPNTPDDEILVNAACVNKFLGFSNVKEREIVIKDETNRDIVLINLAATQKITISEADQF